MSSVDALPLELRRGLRNYWHPIMMSKSLPTGEPVALRRLGEDVVVWRDGDGNAATFADRCPHRGAKLSYGALWDGRLSCRYHGLQFDGSGQCRLVPFDDCEDGPQAREIRAWAYPTEEAAGLVWAYLGDTELFPPPPLELDPILTQEGVARVVWESTWDANWLLMRDNTVDLAHLAFLHGNLAARITDDEGLRLLPLPGGGNPFMTEEITIDSVRQGPKVVETDAGLLITLEGQAGDHSVSFDQVEWELPSVGKVWVPFPGGGEPIRNVQYEVPIDEHRTMVYACTIVSAADDAERAEKQRILEELALPSFQQVFDEDSWMIHGQGDVAVSRATEHLLSCDVGLSLVRQAILEAYEAQQERIRAAHA